jgi:ABC-2 type transport system permease protein
MDLLKIILLFELRQFVRQPVMVGSIVLFLAAGCYGIYSGKQTIKRQITAINSLQQNYQKDYRATLAKFYPDTTQASIAEAADAGNGYMINYRLPQYTTNYPQSLAILAIGQRDIYPYYQKIEKSVNYLDTSNVEVVNPAVLFAGNFDLAFVLIYLLPLLIIALSYNIISQEKEQGTFTWLTIQGVNTHRIIGYKFLFRFILIILLVSTLNGIGFYFAANLNTARAGAWCLVTIGYIFFWFALCYVLVNRQKSSIVSALYLLMGWLVFVVILPSLSNIYLSARYPIPLRADVASFQRHTSEDIWNTEQAILVTTFLKNNPEYKKYYHPKKDTASWGNFQLAGYYDLLERKVNNYAARFEQELRQRNQASAALSRFNPVIETQFLLNALAGTGSKDHAAFVKQSARFQKQWKDFIDYYLLRDVNLKPADLKKIPVFTPDFSYYKPSAIIKNSLLLWLTGLAFVLVSITFKSKEQ